MSSKKCNVCDKTEGLLACAQCKCTFYCAAEHQKQDWSKHKLECIKLQGESFLAENKNKEGVITLPSGLQYKVLKVGDGDSHPTVDSQCDCHYAGRLLNGTEFDSSYKRGEPTAFAPNQVIKGWTEAMQLMVEGDKWEMYLPSDIAYGKRGSPPKIPGDAVLIFEMEIIKIKGKKVPRKK